jgi:hypothetical protein
VEKRLLGLIEEHFYELEELISKVEREDNSFVDLALKNIWNILRGDDSDE